MKIVIRQSSVERDIVSNKIIEDHETHELERARLLSEVENLKIQQEEAEIRRQEADIAEIKAQNEANMARIRRQQEMEEKQHEINKKIKDLEAEKDYDIKRSERAEAAARKDQSCVLNFLLKNWLLWMRNTKNSRIWNREELIVKERTLTRILIIT